MQGTYNGADKRLKYLFDHASEVEITDLLQSGTTIATITIDGQPNAIKSPGSDVSCETYGESGTMVATLTIGGNVYDIYCPVTSEVEYTDLIDDDLTVYETVSGQQVLAYSEPTYKIGELEIDGQATAIYAPPATGVKYESNYQSGVIVGKIIVRTIATDPNNDAGYVADKDEYQIIIPSSSGGGNVDDVVVTDSSGTHSVVQNHIARIDLTDYATDNELSTAVATLQANFQAGVDAIYNACVGKGSTPASHSLADVVDAIYAIGGNTPHAEITSSNTIPMVFSSSVEEDT